MKLRIAKKIWNSARPFIDPTIYTKAQLQTALRRYMKAERRRKSAVVRSLAKSAYEMSKFTVRYASITDVFSGSGSDSLRQYYKQLCARS